MIPDEKETQGLILESPAEEKYEKEEDVEEEEEQDEVMMAGYKECAKEALTWLLNLGYEPGHPLLKSLAAHLTKKQAYLEKLNLEHFLIGEALREAAHNSSGDESENDENLMENKNKFTYNYYAQQIKSDEDIQRALVDAVFRGCNLQYKSNEN